MNRPRLFLSPPHMSAIERELLLEAFDSGYIAPAGPMLDRFEQEFADYTGIPHVVALASGTAALHLALHMLDIGPGDAVITPTLTFIGGVVPILYMRATPIFVDARYDDWSLDTDLLGEALERARWQGLRPAAILPVDLYGQACDISAIQDFADAQGIPVILDSAEGVGALDAGRHAGAIGGMATAFSFNGNKIMTASGGGALASHDPALIARARYLSTAARQPAAHYQHSEYGFNYRLSNLSAAVALGQLRWIETRIERRRTIFQAYADRLGRLPGISFLVERPGTRHTRWLTVMCVDEMVFGVGPEAIRAALEEANIEARPMWKPMHLQPLFAGATIVDRGVAADLFGRGLCLPSGSHMTDDDIDRVCLIVEQVGRSARAAVVTAPRQLEEELP
jgi:dTDP-4-amino-4,6-dideoxygalactose transaminase